MKILFITKYFYPHIGGVEKHVLEISKSLIKKGHKVTIICEEGKSVDGIKVYKISYPKIKLIGLIEIWSEMFRLRKIIQDADIVHIHDVFIWYLPLRFLLANKVFTTFHGWEGVYPIPFLNILQKRLAVFLSFKSMAVGKYIEKYYGIKADKIIYGGTTEKQKTKVKNKNSIVFVGRLEKDTGILEFLNWLKINKKFEPTFVGDGSIRGKCEEIGKVSGFTDPAPYLKNAEYAVPGGYLSFIEAKNFGCKILTFANNQLKKDYWNEIKKIKTFPIWDEVTEDYLKIWKSSENRL